MRGHANLPNNNPDPEQPVNGGNNNQEEPSYQITLSPPGGWESWMPTTGVGDSSDKETIIFTAATEATPDDASVTFKLSWVTRYQGRYMNDKNWTDHNGADLYFAPAAEQDQTLYPGANGKSKITWSGGGKDSTSVTASWKKRPVPTPAWIVIPVNIVCNDYAAYGEIQAMVSAGGKSDIHKIPKDEFPVIDYPSGRIVGNKIADVWEYGAAYVYHLPFMMDCDSGGVKWDPVSEEYVRHGRNSGDGFNVLEEYRGFEINGVHTQLSPTEKDLFIYSSLGPTSDVDCIEHADIGDAGSLSRITVHRVQETEADDNGVMNFTRKNVWGAEKQLRIRVYADDEEDPGGLGGTIGRVYWFFEPVCKIYVDHMFNEFPLMIPLFIDSIIAHEVGHAVGLDHHHGYEGMPIKPPHGEACVMFDDREGHLPDAFHLNLTGIDLQLRWTGSNYADFHERAGEDHWKRYKLHSHHWGHPSYNDF